MILSYEVVKEEFTKRDCILLSTEYLGQFDLLDFICVCKNESKIKYKYFKRGKLCNNCNKKNGTIKQKETVLKNSKIDFDFVKDFFKTIALSNLLFSLCFV